MSLLINFNHLIVSTVNQQASVLIITLNKSNFAQIPKKIKLNYEPFKSKRSRYVRIINVTNSVKNLLNGIERPKLIY
ncbi:hypothetical protein BpHYR1_005018 [Brachionus plicatilis]|uniref:Uncharacterized protein n=1 Tax=Brachionus plicatilis TaxID=10195 RepID=A0A3M7RTE8_BRAPC|nr:hypothetical protein BpHYR1_005018 [Brachionus plicatilis]